MIVQIAQNSCQALIMQQSSSNDEKTPGLSTKPTWRC